MQECLSLHISKEWEMGINGVLFKMMQGGQMGQQGGQHPQGIVSIYNLLWLL